MSLSTATRTRILEEHGSLRAGFAALAPGTGLASMVLGGVVPLGPLCSSMVAKLSRQRSQDTAPDYAAGRNRSQRGKLTWATPSSGHTMRAATQVEDPYSQ